MLAADAAARRLALNLLGSYGQAAGARRMSGRRRDCAVTRLVMLEARWHDGICRSTGLSGIWEFLCPVLLPFLFVLTVVVFIHELGHFLVARWCGVKVKAFSIGFGKEIFGFYDRYGTRWRFAWIPLGGYVKFLDDENSASVPSRDALER